MSTTSLRMIVASACAPLMMKSLLVSYRLAPLDLCKKWKTLTLCNMQISQGVLHAFLPLSVHSTLDPRSAHPGRRETSERLTLSCGKGGGCRSSVRGVQAAYSGGALKRHCVIICHELFNASLEFKCRSSMCAGL
jgi:hypothetical protein